MAQAKSGDSVKVHYTGKLEDGSEFDSSRGGDPMEFTLGTGQIIKGFEDAVMGMSPGESKTVSIAPEEGYGEHRSELVAEVNSSEMPDDLDPTVGDTLQMEQEGSKYHVTVSAITDETVTLDGNHPLSGKTLVFDLELTEIG